MKIISDNRLPTHELCYVLYIATLWNMEYVHYDLIIQIFRDLGLLFGAIEPQKQTQIIKTINYLSVNKIIDKKFRGKTKESWYLLNEKSLKRAQDYELLYRFPSYMERKKRLSM